MWFTSFFLAEIWKKENSWKYWSTYQSSQNGSKNAKMLHLEHESIQGLLDVVYILLLGWNLKEKEKIRETTVSKTIFCDLTSFFSLKLSKSTKGKFWENLEFYVVYIVLLGWNLKHKFWKSWTSPLCFDNSFFWKS